MNIIILHKHVAYIPSVAPTLASVSDSMSHLPRLRRKVNNFLYI